MSSSQKIMMYVGVGLLVTLAAIGLWMLLQCKGVKHEGKCYTVIAQADPTSTLLTDVAKIKDGNMDTSASKTAGTTDTTITLNVKDATTAAPKKVKGARITAMADAPSSGTGVDKKIKLDGLEFVFKQDGKKDSVFKLFSTEKSVTGTIPLVVPSGITVYEVELI